MTWLALTDRAGWPVHFIYALEVCFAAVAILLIAVIFQERRKRSHQQLFKLAIFAGVFTALALLFPVALAPLFFGMRGEIMLASLPLALLLLPMAIGSFVFLFAKTVIFPARRNQ